MKRAYVAIIGILFAVPLVGAQAGGLTVVGGDGWTVTADAGREVLSVDREGLGRVLKEIRLNLRGADGLQELKGWKVDRKGEGGLSIRTSEPRTAWVLELGPRVIKIASTSAEAMLTAEAPAPPDRIVARLLDPEGVPVTWEGMEEVKNGYGGGQTKNPSFLPRRNPEVMCFSLGQASGSNFHSLFDRTADTGIDFPEETVM